MYILAPTTGGVLAGIAHRGHLLAHNMMNINDKQRSALDETVAFIIPAYDKSYSESIILQSSGNEYAVTNWLTGAAYSTESNFAGDLINEYLD